MTLRPWSIMGVFAAGAAGCSTLLTPLPDGVDQDTSGAPDREPEDTFSLDDTFAGGGPGDTQPSGNPDVDADVANCTPPIVALTPEAPVTSGTGFDASRALMSMFAFTTTSTVGDFLDPDGVELAGTLEFDIYDAADTVRCTVLADVSAVPMTSPTALAPDAWAGWQFTLPDTTEMAAVDFSNPQQPVRCDRLTTTTRTNVGLDTRDTRELVSIIQFVSLAIGPASSDLINDLREAFASNASVNFDSDILPYVFAVHLEINGQSFPQSGYGFRFDSECATLRLDSSGSVIYEPKPRSAWPGGITRLYSAVSITYTP